MPPPSDLVTIKTACRTLRCHCSTAYRLVKSGRLRAYRRATSRIFVSRADVEALLVLVEPTAAPSARASEAA
jgi:excisionase family DNA binding protein